LDAYKNLSSIYDRLMTDVPYDDWLSEIVQLLMENQISSEASICDVGCGTGRIAIGLSQKGYHVIASDISPEMLSIADQNAQETGETISFICQPITKLYLTERQDAITAVCDVINYVSPADLDKAFRSVFRALKSGGVFIFDVSSAYKLSKIIDNNVFFEDFDDFTYIWTNCNHGKYVDMDIILFEKREDGYRRREEHHQQYIHEESALIEKLKWAGFKKIDFFDGYHHKHVNKKSERVLFVAQKA